MPIITHELVKESSHLPVYFNTGNFDIFSVPAHWHDYVELIYMHSGKMSAVVQAQKYQLQANDILIVNRKILHMTENNGRCTGHTLLQIPTRLLLQFIPDFHLLQLHSFFPGEESGASKDMRGGAPGSGSDLQWTVSAMVSDSGSDLRALLDDMISIFTKKEDGYPLLFTARLYELIFLLYKKYSYRLTASADKNHNKDLNRIIHTVDWIRDNYRQPLTLSMAAQHLGVSREYFCRLFKEYTGQTFLEYLSTLRTISFYEELGSSDLSIPILMEHNGITNYKTFMREFKRLYGTTPQKMRNAGR